jgi:hypothetical protein
MGGPPDLETTPRLFGNVTKGLKTLPDSLEHRHGRRGMHKRLLAEEPEGKRPLGKSRCIWVDKTKLDLRQHEVIWIRDQWWAFVNMEIKFHVE